MSIESLCGPTPCVCSEEGREAVSGYLTILSLCCCSSSKNRSKAEEGRFKDSAIREVKLVESLDIQEM